MKYKMVLFIVCLAFLINAQTSILSSSTVSLGCIQATDSISGKYDIVDTYVLGINQSFSDIQELAKAITTPFKTEKEKVRAIFRWMTTNIAYDYDDLKSHQRQLDKIHKQYIYNAEYYYALKVLQSKKGVCQGYATLFNELCKASGIKSKIVVGFASPNIKIVHLLKKIHLATVIHAWNKVRIQNKWYYIDTTWASGYIILSSKKFKKQLNPVYYLTEENKIFDSHIEVKD